MLLRRYDLFIACLLLLLNFGHVIGTTIRVPQDCATIQTAFDSLGNGDTVLVAVGVYAEALVAPPLAFVLRGDVLPGPGEYPRPIVDPSALPGSDSLACLVLPFGSQPVIEDMKFRNGPQMYPRRRMSDYGGIVCASTHPILRRCLVDSCYIGLKQSYDTRDVRIELESCRFLNDSLSCIEAVFSVKVAINCLFSGRGARLVNAGSGSRLIRCHFRDNDQGHLLLVNDGDVEVRDCIFGPTGPFGFPVVSANVSSAAITDNIFVDCELGPSALRISVDSLQNSTDSILVLRNTFLRNRVVMGGGCAGIVVAWASGFGDRGSCWISGNVFAECISRLAPPTGMWLLADAVVQRNRFFSLEPPTTPAVRIESSNIPFYENLFFETGIALQNVANGLADARWNWWGDSTGPYHASFNPEGRGDEVQGNVWFDPWYPDTSFLRTERELRLPAPQAYALNAYPNPFNAAAHVALDVPDAGIFRVEVFDVLGRCVRELFWGPVGLRKELVLDGSALTSGVYFIRATDTILNRPVAAAKVVLLR